MSLTGRRHAPPPGLPGAIQMASQKAPQKALKIMRKLTPALAGLLFSTTALVTPGAVLAQTATAPDEPTEVGEVVVLGRFIPEPMRETSEVATFLSGEDLKRQGDDNAAKALTRLTGLSLVAGRFVYVRGLGERYSSALLNGSPLPSPEPLQRVVPLDLFPSNVLAGAAVQKTYSANYPGEFGGGVIDLQTVSLPNEAFLSFGVSVGGDTETTLRSGIDYYGSETDFLGYDDGTRDMPDLLRAAIDTGNRVTPGPDFTDSDIQRIGRSFVNAPLNLIQSVDRVPFNYSLTLSVGDTFDIGMARLGVIAVAGFDSDWSTRHGKQQQGIVSSGAMEVRTDYDFTSTQQDVVVNGLVGVGLEWGEHVLRWTNLYVHTTTKEARIREGFSELTGADVRDDFTEWFERDLLNTQITGEHAWGPLEIDWRAAMARSTRHAPYEKWVRYRLVDGVYLHNATQEQNYTRFSEVEDEIASAGVEAAYAVPLSSVREIVISGGLAYSDNDRQASQREFRFLALNDALPDQVQRQRPDFLFADFNIGPDRLVLTERTGAEGAAVYEAQLEVKAAYGQIDAEIIPLVRGSVGVRYEDATQQVEIIDPFGLSTPLQPPALENTYWLPATTVTWNFYEDMQLRLGASKTIARPQFRELAPQIYTDPDVDREFVGNRWLTDSELLNLDARYEWYFGAGEFFTLGTFYKQIDKPIEAVVADSSAGTVQQTYLNAPGAMLYGGEVEVKKYFEAPIEADWFATKRWLVSANYTYSKSEVQADDGDTVLPYDYLPGTTAPEALDYVTDGAQMQGQSEHLANLLFGFEDDMAQSQATILVTYVSERISARGRLNQPDLVQDPGVNVDFTYRRGFQIAGRDLEFGIEARNLLEENYEEYQEQGGGRVDALSYDRGRGISFSLSARF